jgi:hypothetical protein
MPSTAHRGGERRYLLQGDVDSLDPGVLGLRFAYLVLYVVVLAARARVVPGDVMASSLRHDATLGDYATAAWFAASMAIVVGAIGSGLETDDEVRETVSR